MRLHRQIAEAIESRVQAHGRNPMEHAAELAYQYQRSAAMPGAERGIGYAIAAADNAESAAAWDEAAGYLQIALELMPEDDEMRADVAGRLAMALAWALREDEALDAARHAIGVFEQTRGAYGAGAFASQVASESFGAGFTASAWSLATRALELLGETRDVAWARARSLDLMRREAEDPDNPGMPMLSPERLELLDILERIEDEDASEIYATTNWLLPRLQSRDDAVSRLARFKRGDAPRDHWVLFFSAFQIGDYDAGEEFCSSLGEVDEESGLLAPAVSWWSQAARMQICRGELADARRTLRHVEELVPRLTRDSLFLIQYSGGQSCTGDGIVACGASTSTWNFAAGGNVTTGLTIYGQSVTQPPPATPLTFPAMMLAPSTLWTKADVKSATTSQTVSSPTYLFGVANGSAYERNWTFHNSNKLPNRRRGPRQETAAASIVLRCHSEHT